MDHDPSTSPSSNPATSSATTDQAVGEVWRAHRSYLVNLAARTLSDRTEAEDVVQEAFGQLAKVPLDEIDDVRGWLTVVVRRMSLNRLRSAYHRREEAVGAGDERAVATGAEALSLPTDPGDPADRVTLDDQVQRALAVVLDRLTPAERTSFVLHDVFGFPFDAVAEIVGRTPAACRQLASRARRSVQADAQPLPAGPAGRVATAAQHDVAERFVAVCSGGDIGELMALLDPDVVGDARLIGGRLLSHLEGAVAVATRILGMFGPDAGATLVPLDIVDDAGVVALYQGRLLAAIRLDEHDGLIHHFHAFVLRP